MRKNKTLIWWKQALFPLCFVLSGLINLFFFYFGLSTEYSVIRKYGFIICNMFFAVMCVVSFMVSMRKRELPKKTLIIFFLTLIFWCSCYAVCYIQFGLSIKFIEYAEQFVCFSIPCFIAGVLTVVWNTEEKFPYIIRNLGYLALPGAAIYVIKAVFFEKTFAEGRTLGLLNYMNVAYLFMVFLLAQIFYFVENKQSSKKRSILILDAVSMVVFSYAILASGTRGTYLCIIGFCVMYIVINLITRKSISRCIAYLSGFLAVIIISACVYTLPGLDAVARMNIFVKGIQEKQLVTSISEDESVVENIDYMVGLNVEEGEERTQYTELGEGVDEQPIFKMKNRGTLYKVALKEFIKSPLKGLGPIGYSIKYNIYPHNIILELLCELGIIVAIPIVVIVVYIFIKLFLYACTRSETKFIFLLFVAYGLYANMSGTLWTCREFMGFLGYGLAYISCNSSIKDNE